MLEPNTKADIVFSVSEDVTAACQSYGVVTVPKAPQIQKEVPVKRSTKYLPAELPQWQATGEGLKTAMVEEMSQVELKSANSNGKLCNIPTKSLECALVSEIRGSRVRGKVKSSGQKRKICYRPTIKGRHQLHIQISGQHIRGSPFSVAVKSSMKIGNTLATIDTLNRPRGITLNHRGELVVAESDASYVSMYGKSGTQCVSVYSQSGQRLHSFGTHGSGPGEMERPYGVAVDKNGNIFVADTGNNKILKYTADGHYMSGSSGPFHYPLDIAYNPSNNKLYVVDVIASVKALNSDLTTYISFGKFGNNVGELQNVRGIACDSIGRVYVADSGNHHIQVFTAEGRFVKEFGRQKMKCPIGVAVDTSGMVYVSDIIHSKVFGFTAEGKCVERFGEFKIRGITVDTSRVVYVCDADNRRIQLF